MASIYRLLPQRQHSETSMNWDVMKWLIGIYLGCFLGLLKMAYSDPKFYLDYIDKKLLVRLLYLFHCLRCAMGRALFVPGLCHGQH